MSPRPKKLAMRLGHLPPRRFPVAPRSSPSASRARLAARRLGALVAVTLAGGCSAPKGTLDGIAYETSLEGRYELVAREGGREHVWFPSDPSERPALSLRVQNPSAPIGEEPRCQDYGAVTWGNGFVPTPEGKLRNGTSVGTGLCAPSRPDKMVACNVFWTHGEIARHEEKEPFVKLCRGVTLH